MIEWRLRHKTSKSEHYFGFMSGRLITRLCIYIINEKYSEEKIPHDFDDLEKNLSTFKRFITMSLVLEMDI